MAKKVLTTQAEISVWKWYILCLGCVVTLGGYYSFDFPSVLHNQLYRHFTANNGASTQSMTTEQENLIRDNFELEFNLLFSLYSLPNMILPLIGGVFIDKVGNNKVMLATSILVLLGNLILTTASYLQNISLFLFGRFIFGLGAETLQVCVNTTIAKWFIGYELAFALGINLSGCKLGGVLTDWISPYIETHYGMNYASLAVSLLCVFSFAFTLLLIYVEPEIRISHPKFHVDHAHARKVDTNRFYYEQIQDKDSTEVGSLELQKLDSQTLTHAPQKNQLYHQSEHHYLDVEAEEIPTTFIEGESMLLRHINQVYYDLHEFSISSWNIFILTFLMYGIFIPFSNIANVVLLEVYYNIHDVNTSNAELLEVQQKAEVSAAWLQSIPYLLTLFCNPVLGYLVDYMGYRTGQLCLATLLLVIAHSFIYAVPSLGAVLPLCLIGLSYSVFGSVSWACIPIIVEDSLHGTAYGIMASFQNSGQFLIPFLVQGIFRDEHSYIPCELLFTALSLFALVLSVALWCFDEWYGNSKLRLP